MLSSNVKRLFYPSLSTLDPALASMPANNYRAASSSAQAESHKPISDPRYRSAEPQTEIARLLLTTVVNALLPFQHTLIQAESTLLCYSVFLQASMLSVHCAYGLVTMRVPAPGVARHVHALTVGATRSRHCSSLATN